MTVSAQDVKKLRDQTGLPLMDCKRALTETQGDFDAAIRWLRERGAKLLSSRADRVTEFGRVGIYADSQVGAMVELKCESAPVAQLAEFNELAQALARQLALGPGASSAEELLDQPSPVRQGQTLRQHRDDLFNQVREVFNVGRLVRIQGRCGGYQHVGARIHGVLVQAEGGSDEALRDICMHVAAMAPLALKREDLDPALVEAERQVLREATLREGKPANIVDKIIEGRLKSFYAERVLLEQPFVKDNSLTVAQFASAQGIQIVQFVHWIVGQG
ncbi:MAG: elongation factor Ts [Pirellulaceae bacterium]|nr:MAG: elongation factor Ts [Pirellulaceae bacterium]